MPLPDPHGGRLVDGFMASAEREEAIEDVLGGRFPTYPVSLETAREIENIATGLYSPLEGFMGPDDLDPCLETGRLAGGVPWTLPVLFLVGDEAVRRLFGSVPGCEGRRLGLTHGDGLLAVMEIREAFPVDRERMARQFYGTDSLSHPGVADLRSRPGWALAGRVRQVRRLDRPPRLAMVTPAETRELFALRGWETVVAFQTRNAPHLGHEYVQKTALTFADGLLISPVLGPKKEGDFADEAIVEAYRALLAHYYPEASVALGSIAYAMRYGGPKEAIHHAIMRKNLGCARFIVGRDHAGVGRFYGPYDAQAIFSRYPDLGITPVLFREFFHCRRCGGVVNPKICPHEGDDVVAFSGTRVREALVKGETAGHLIRPEVAEALARVKDPFVRTGAPS